MNRDLIGEEGGMNLYGFCKNNTIEFSSRSLLEKGARKAFRKTHKIASGVVHHINPIKGHPPVKGMRGGQIARFPLPFEWAARGEWNLTWYASAAEHSVAHRRMMQLESLDIFREITFGTRQVGNHVINKLNSDSETKCWDSVDLNVYFYSISDGNLDVNSIPESVSISIEEYWRQ